MTTKNVMRGGVIGVLALVVTTLGISASDSLRGVSGSLLGQLGGTTASTGCPSGMTATPMLATMRCVDTYEAAPADDCPHTVTRTETHTTENIAAAACTVHSKAGASPWVFATREQARLMCMRSGKRLPTAAEWYQLAIGTSAERCVVDGQMQLSGTHSDCVSAIGVHDAVGNVWEWVSEDVTDGMYNGRELPPEGYVTQAGTDGMAVYTGASGADEFGQDFFWSKAEGVYGILRGGFYGSRTDAGVYAVQAKTAPTMSTQAIGFRCVL